MKVINILRGGLDMLTEQSKKVIPMVRNTYEATAAVIITLEEKGARIRAMDAAYDEYVVIMAKLGELYKVKFEENLDVLKNIDQSITNLYEDEDITADELEEAINTVLKQVIKMVK